jgi:hypothetical protein
MILVDANLLLYAKYSDYDQHAAAVAWLDGQLNGTARVGLPWESLLAFVRIGTNPRLRPRPMSWKQAWGQVEDWLALPNVWTPLPSERHAAILGELLGATRATGNLVADAHLAALAIGHGLLLCSTDGDFARFADLRWQNPIG